MLRLLNQRAQEQEYFDRQSGVERVAEQDSLFVDGLGNVDSRIIDVLSESMLQPYADPMRQAARLTRANHMLDILGRGPRNANAVDLRRVLSEQGSFATLVEKFNDPNEGEVTRTTSASSVLVDTMQRALVDRLINEDPEYVARSQVAMGLLESMDNFIESYKRVTDNKGVNLPGFGPGATSEQHRVNTRGMGTLITTDHGAAFVDIIQRARMGGGNTLDFGMFQTENSVLVAEMAMTMEQAAKTGGRVSITMNAPVSITYKNALTFGTLRRWRNRLSGDTDGISVDWDPWTSTKSLSAHVGSGSERDIPRIAHQKFVGAGLGLDPFGTWYDDKSQQTRYNYERMGFAVSTANATAAAMGPIAMDGAYAPKLGNFEVTTLITAQTMGISHASTDQEKAIFRELMEAGQIAARFVHGRDVFGNPSREGLLWDPGNNGVLSDAMRRQGYQRFFVDGPGSARAVTHILSELQGFLNAGNSRHGEVVLHIDAFSTKGPWQTLRNNLINTAHGTQTKVRIAMQALKLDNLHGAAKKNWDNLVKAGLISGDTHELKATGKNLALIQKILDLSHPNIEFIDTFGRRYHAKGITARAYNDHGDLDFVRQLTTSANISARAMGDFDPNVELGIYQRWSDFKHLDVDVEAMFKRLGISTSDGLRALKFVTPTEDDLTRPQAAGTIYNVMSGGVYSWTAGDGKLYKQMETSIQALRAKHNLSARISASESSNAHFLQMDLDTGYGQIQNLIELEMHITKNARDIFLPKFHRTVRGALAVSGKTPGKYTKVETLSSAELVTSTAARAMTFVRDRVVRQEMRLLAIRQLMVSNGGLTPNEGQIEARLTEMMNQVSYQQMIRQRAVGFMRDAFGIIEPEPYGERAYRAKEYRRAVYELDEKTNLYKPADISFRQGALRAEDNNIYFQRPGDSYMMRSGMINPATGLPVIQTAKVYTSDAFNTISFGYVNREKDRRGNNREFLSIFLPIGKIMQLPQRIGNVFSGTRYTQFLVGDNDELIEEQKILAPIQPKEFNVNLEETWSRHYGQMFLMNIGYNFDGDISIVNEDYFYEKGKAKRVLGIRRTIRDKIEKSRMDAGVVMQALDAQRAGEGQAQIRITEPSIVIGEQTRTIGRFGPQKVRRSIRNPAGSRQKTGGFAVFESIHGEDSREYDKVNLELNIVSGSTFSGGNRWAGVLKTVGLVYGGGEFKQWMNQHGELSQKYLGVKSSADITAIVNTSNVKHGEIYLQTGAMLLRNMGSGIVSSFNEYVDGGHDGYDLIRRGLERRVGWILPGKNDKHSFMQKLGLTDGINFSEDFNRTYSHLTEAQRSQMLNVQMAKLLKLEGGAFNKAINKSIKEALRNADQTSDGITFKVDNVKHQLGAMLAMVWWEQVHIQRAIHRGGSASLKQQKSSGFVSGMDVMARVDDDDIFNMPNVYIPMWAPTGIASNTTALSSRPEVNILTYLNFNTGHEAYKAMFPGMTEEGKAMMHIASLMTHGRGAMSADRPLTKVMFGVHSAPLFAVLGAKVLHKSRTVQHDGQQTQMVGMQDLVSIVHGMQTGTISHAKGQEQLSKLAGGKFSPEQQFAAMNYLMTNSTHDAEADTPGTKITSEEVFELFEKAGIGALKIIVPEVGKTKTRRGGMIQFKGFTEVLMPDVRALKAIMNTHADISSDTAGSFLQLLEILQKEHSTLAALHDIYSMTDKELQDKGVTSRNDLHVEVTDQTMDNLVKINTLVLKINDWYTNVFNTDLVTNLYGRMSMGGTTFTATTEQRMPFGFVAYGEEAWQGSLKNRREYLMENKYSVEQGKPASGWKEAMYADMGVGDYLAKGLRLVGMMDRVTGRSKKGLMTPDQFIAEKERALLNKTSVVETRQRLAKSFANTYSKLIIPELHDVAHDIFINAISFGVTDEARQKLIDFAHESKHQEIHNMLDAFDAKLNNVPNKILEGERMRQQQIEFYKQYKAKFANGDVDSIGRADLLEWSLKALDGVMAQYDKTADGFLMLSHDKDARAMGKEVFELLKQKRRERTEAKIKDLLAGDVDKQTVLDVHNMLVDLAISNPAHMVTYGARSGSPQGSEHDWFTVISIEDFNDLMDLREGAGKGRRLSPIGNRHAVVMNSMTMGLTLGDFDGDQVSLQNVNRYTMLKMLQASGKAKGPNADKAKMDKITAELLEAENGLLEAKTGESIIKSAADLTQRRDFMALYNLGKQTGDRRKMLDAINQAGQVIAQVRGLYDNHYEFMVGFAKAKEKVTNQLSEQGITFGSDSSHWQDVQRIVADNASAKAQDAISKMMVIGSDKLRFMQEYVGFAGTEIIGKTFNASFSLIENMSAFFGRSELHKAFNNLNDAQHQNGQNPQTRAQSLAGFAKALNQMARDSLKPKGSDDKVLEMLKWSMGGAEAAVRMVTGARTAALLNAMVHGKTTARDLMGNVMADTDYELEDVKFGAQSFDKWKQAAGKMAKQFVLTAGREWAKFLYDQSYKMTADQEKKLNDRLGLTGADRIEGSHLSGDVLMTMVAAKVEDLNQVHNFLYSVSGKPTENIIHRQVVDMLKAGMPDTKIENDITLEEIFSNEKYVTALNKVEVTVQGDLVGSGLRGFIGDIVRKINKKSTLGQPSIEDKARTMTGAEYLLSKSLQGQLVNMLSSGDPDTSHLDNAISLMIGGEQQVGYLDRAREALHHRGIGIDAYGNEVDVRVRAGALMQLLAKPTMERTPGTTERILADLESQFAAAEDKKAFVQTLNEGSFAHAGLGDVIAEYHENKDMDAALGKLGQRDAADTFLDSAIGGGLHETLKNIAKGAGEPTENAPVKKLENDMLYRSKLDQAFSASEKFLGRFTGNADGKRSSQGGHATLELTSGVVAGVIGASVGMAIEKRHGSAIAEGIMGLIGSNPAVMGQLSQGSSIKDTAISMGAMSIGMGAGAASQALITTTMQQGGAHRWRSGLFGFLANAVISAAATSVSALLARRFWGEQEQPSTKVIASAGGMGPSISENKTMAMLSNELPGLADDLTQTAELEMEDTDGNQYFLEIYGAGRYGLDNMMFASEEGEELLSEARSSLDDRFTSAR